MKKKDYDVLIQTILNNVGGKGNITNCLHCMTRLRLNVKDKSIVNLEEIEKDPDVVGVQWSNEQLQIIIGQNVGTVYDQFCDTTGLNKEKEVNDLDVVENKKKFWIGALFDVIASCLTPLISLLIGVGLIKTVVIIGELSGILKADMQTYQVLTFVADSGFYFLPVFIGATAARKFGANMGLGMLMGAMLVHLTFVQSVASGEALSVFGIPIYQASYSSTIFPAILSVYIMSKIEKQCAKYCPEVLRTILVPLVTILIMMPLTLCLLAPAGAFLGVYFSQAIIWLYDMTGFLGVAVLAALIPISVMTGMHAAFMPYMFQSLATLKYEPIVCTAMIISNINQGAASLAVSIKSKDRKVKSVAASASIAASLGGVTEPAMFGINLKYKKPLYAAMIGSFCGALFGGIMKVYAYSFAGSSGIFALTGFVGPEASNVIFMAISIAIGVIVTFILTLILFKEERCEK